MENPTRKIRLGVLFGGMSGEHEVSISSATAVIAALDPAEFEIMAIAITRDGRLAGERELRSMLPPELLDRVLLCGGADGLQMLTCGLLDGSESPQRRPDIVFPLLHGPNGEDGTIQGFLEIAGVPYVGSGVLASAAGMDKEVMKSLFAGASLPVVPFHVESTQGLEDRTEAVRSRIESRFTYPVFSKPANLGSSVGVRKIHHAGEFRDAVLYSARFDGKILIEQGIDGRELECAVLGNEHAEASGVGEIFPACEFYDYAAKYINPDSRTQIPAEISAGQEEEIRAIALRAFHCIQGAGLARVDFFLERKTGKIWLNEINTMPGFTSISMYPKLWAARGVPFDRLVRRLVDLGLEGHFERRRRQRQSIVSELAAGAPNI